MMTEHDWFQLKADAGTFNTPGECYRLCARVKPSDMPVDEKTELRKAIRRRMALVWPGPAWAKAVLAEMDRDIKQRKSVALLEWHRWINSDKRVTPLEKNQLRDHLAFLQRTVIEERRQP